MAQKHQLQILFSPLFLIFSWFFASIAFCRAIFYTKLFPQKQYKAKIPVLCVGNISWGGTGKSPVIDYLLKFFYAHHKTAFVLSRGYGVKLPYYPFLLDKNTDTCSFPLPDEPLMLLEKNPESKILLSPSRVLSACYAEKNFPQTNYLLMDDGFQHFALARQYNVVLLDVDDLKQKSFFAKLFDKTYNWNTLIPLGSWREPKNALHRANIFLIKCPQQQWEEQKEIFLKKIVQYNKPVFVFSIEIENIVPLFSNPQKTITEYAILAGIGNPLQFQQTLENYLQLSCKKTFFLADHAKMDIVIDEIKKITIPIICTEKDAVKLKKYPELQDKEIYYTQTKCLFHSHAFYTHHFDIWLLNEILNNKEKSRDIV